MTLFGGEYEVTGHKVIRIDGISSFEEKRKILLKSNYENSFTELI